MTYSLECIFIGNNMSGKKLNIFIEMLLCNLNGFDLLCSDFI